MRVKLGLCAMGMAGFMLTSVQSALAQERSYDAQISLGFVNATGNTETTTFNGTASLTLRQDVWTHTMKLEGLGSQEDEMTTAERYYFEDKSDYNFSDDQYFFVKGSYTDDRFSGFEYQATTSFGYGRHLIRNDDFELEAYGGTGYRYNDIEDEETEGEVLVSLGENLSWRISDSTALTQSLLTEVGEDRTVTKFEIGLESTIIARIATKIAFQVRNTSEVPEGREKTDTLTSVSLVYTF